MVGAVQVPRAIAADHLDVWFALAYTAPPGSQFRLSSSSMIFRLSRTRSGSGCAKARVAAG
jgi:hypothetical protein